MFTLSWPFRWGFLFEWKPCAALQCWISWSTKRVIAPLKGSCPRWVIAISFWRRKRTDFSWRKGNVYWYVQSSPVLYSYCFGWSCCCRFRVPRLIWLCCFLLLVIIPISRARGVGKGHTSTRREESWDGDESKPTRLRTVRTSWRACWRWLWVLFPLQWRLLAFSMGIGNTWSWSLRKRWQGMGGD